MESKILLSCEFNLNHISSLNFLERYIFLSQANEKVYMISRYLIELALIELKMMRYSPSNLAASALFLSNNLMNISLWSDVL